MSQKTFAENIKECGFDPEKVNIEVDGTKISRYEVVVDSSGSFVLRFMRDEKSKPLYKNTPRKPICFSSGMNWRL